MTRQLTKYDAACRALAEAHRIDEVKDFRDKYFAMEVYAKQARNGELIAHATAIRKRAERRLGELMAEDRKAGKLAKGTRGSRIKGARVASGPTLADQGIDKHLADRARKAAEMPEEKFEEHVAKTVRVAVAATEGDAAVVKEARKEQQDKKRARRAEREAALGAKLLAMPEGKVGVLVEDFEWDYVPYSRETGMDRHAGNHYPVSEDAHTAQEIVERTKDRFACAADDCVLFMWTTVPHTAIAIDVLRLRGFEYASHYVWNKDRIGTGHWSRNKHEVLLIGTRGKIPCPAPGTQWDSVINAAVGKHSEKPECFLEMIEAYYPNVPKIELNRRGPPRPGWHAWGNEVETNEAAE
jgi:N6-adenosine-specific RNA methylase IME4